MQVRHHLRNFRILFIHNAFAEYRFAFWEKLRSKAEVDLLITHKGLEKKIYGLANSVSHLNELYWSFRSWFDIPSKVAQYDIVILPPTDSLLDFVICLHTLTWCKIKGVKTILWSESWVISKQLLYPIKAFKIVISAIMKIIVGNGVDGLIVPGKKSYKYITALPIYNAKDKTYIVVDSSTSPKTKEIFDIRKQYGMSSSARIILFLGRIIKVKGLDVLIKASNELVQSNEVYILVAGDGEERESCEKLVNNKSKEKIKFIGKVSPSSRRLFYEQSDVFVIPSRLYKGGIDIWALTVNEALECGTPVISTTDVGASYDLINERNGRVVHSNDVDELREALYDVLFREKLYLRRSEIATSYNRGASITDMVNGFISAFENV